MKRNYAFILALSCAFVPVAFGQAAPQQQQKSAPPPPKTAQESPAQRQKQKNALDQITIPPLPAFHPREPRRFVLPNGLVVFLQENHELPIIGGTMRFRGGDVDVPASKIGLTDIYGSVWRTGGTKQRTGDELDDFLEARAAKVETSSSEESTSISFNSLKEDFDTVFPVFRELLAQPEFREDKIDLVKRQIFGIISRRNDDVDEIAGRESAKLAYGAQNPYARVAEYATVAAVTRQDLLDWHAKYVRPDNAMLGIYGDFDPAKMEALIHESFGSWGTPLKAPKKPATPRKPIKANVQFNPAVPGLYFIPKEDVDQSSIQMVTLGIERDNPDYFAVSVMNEVLSGGFASRLFSNLRTKEGLAYAVGGGVGSDWDHLGIQGYSIATKSSNTAKAIDGLKEQLVGMVTNPPDENELKIAKDNILNSFVFRFDSKQKVLAEQMTYDFYGYPSDYLERYRTAIEKVTPADVKRVAEKYLHPDKLAVLVVGNPIEIGDQLTKMGQVKTIDITIPQPPGAPASAAGGQPQQH